MTIVLLVLNSCACFAIFWVCGTFLLVRDRATRMRQMVTQVGLLLSMVGAFSTGLMPFVHGLAMEWPTVLLRTGIGMVALTQYDKAFGIAAQARLVVIRIATLPMQISAWWAERLAIAHRHARTKRWHGQ